MGLLDKHYLYCHINKDIWRCTTTQIIGEESSSSTNSDQIKPHIYIIQISKIGLFVVLLDLFIILCHIISFSNLN